MDDKSYQNYLDEEFKYLDKYKTCNTYCTEIPTGKETKVVKVVKYVNGKEIDEGQQFPVCATFEEAVDLTKKILDEITKTYKHIFIRQKPRFVFIESGGFCVYFRVAAI